MPFHPGRPARRRRRPSPSDQRQPTGPRPPDANAAQLLYTPAEAAALLRVGESWLRRKVAARLIPSTFLGRHLRFSAADLAAIVADHAQPVGVARGVGGVVHVAGSRLDRGGRSERGSTRP